MQKRTFILCDPDNSYVNRFMNYSQRRANFPFRVSGFTKGEGVAAYLEGGSAEAALIAWSLWMEWEEELRQKVQEMVPCVMLLTEDRRSGQMDMITLYKYQSMDALLREALSVYEKLAKSREEEHRVELVGFYSPVGHCGKTTAALHLGQMLSEKEGQEILYVNMEPLGTWTGQGTDQQHSFSDLLYERRLSEEMKLQSLSRSYLGISVLSPVVNPMDLWSIDMEERALLIREMQEAGIGDKILLDLPSDADPVPLLACCDRIVLVRRAGTVMEQQMDQMRGYLQKKLEREDFVEMVLPEFPALAEHFPGDEGGNCRELGEWIWTQWMERMQGTEGQVGTAFS